MHAKENAQLQVTTSTADPERLQGKQQLVYDAVHSHMQTEDPEPLRMIVSGRAGTGTGISHFLFAASLLRPLACYGTNRELLRCSALVVAYALSV